VTDHPFRQIAKLMNWKIMHRLFLSLEIHASCWKPTIHKIAATYWSAVCCCSQVLISEGQMGQSALLAQPVYRLVNYSALTKTNTVCSRVCKWETWAWVGWRYGLACTCGPLPCTINTVMPKQFFICQQNYSISTIVAIYVDMLQY